MNILFVLFFGFGFYRIYALKTYPPKLYDSLGIIATPKNLNRNYFENCVYAASVLAGNISEFNSSEIEDDETLVPIALKLNDNVLTIKNVGKLIDGETFLMNTFNNMMTSYLLLFGSPSKKFQNKMRKCCARNSNEKLSLIDIFNSTINMISRSYMARNNFTDDSFQEFTEFSYSIATQVAVTYPICEIFNGKSPESAIETLETMMKKLNKKLHQIDEERRQKFWNPDFISYVFKKLIDNSTTTNDQILSDKIQRYFENNYEKTDYIFSTFIFNNSTLDFTKTTNNIYIYNYYSKNKKIILTRSNERNHCFEFDKIEENVKNACVDGNGNKTENIKNYLTAKCPNSTVAVLDVAKTNYIFSTNTNNPSVKISNMSYAWKFFFEFYEQCLKRVIIGIVNN